MKNLIIVIFFMAGLSASAVHAQEYAFGSALTQSVGGVVSLVPSSPAVLFSHPALMGFAQTKTSAEVSYRQLFGLAELEDFSVHGRHRIHQLNTGLSIMRFGEAGLYQEYTIAGGTSFQLNSRLSLGAAMQYSSAEFGDGQARYAGAELALSAAYRPISSVLISGAARRLAIDEVYDNFETDPVYEATLAWASPSEVSLGAIWTREGQGDHRFALGQILNLTQNLDFLAGLRFDPVRYTLGGRAHYRGMSLVYAFEGHPDLGSTHSFGLGWNR